MNMIVVLELHGTCGVAGTVGPHQLKPDKNNDKSREDALKQERGYIRRPSSS
jgi:hypothetical protein